MNKIGSTRKLKYFPKRALDFPMEKFIYTIFSINEKNHFLSNPKTIKVITNINDSLSYLLANSLVNELNLDLTEENLERTKSVLKSQVSLSPFPEESASWAQGISQTPKPKNRYQIMQWQTFNLTHVFYDLDDPFPSELSGIHIHLYRFMTFLTID